MDILEYVKYLQYYSASITAFFMLFFFLVPGTIKGIILARVLRQRVALGFISTDSGYTYLDKLTQVEDKNHKLGLFTGNKSGYLVTPRPTSDIKTRELVQEVPVMEADGVTPKVDADGNQIMEEKVIQEQYFDIQEEDKHVIDETILKKHVMDFGGIPVYFGYLGKSTVVSPSLLEAMTTYDKDIRDKEIHTLTLMDPKALKKYIPWTINPNIFDAIEWKAEQVGYLGRPPLETLKKLAVPIVIVAVLVLGYIGAKRYGYI